MDLDRVLGEFDRQVRQRTEPDGTGASYERHGPVIRRLAPPGQGGSGVFWSGFGGADADQVIRSEVAFFRGRGESFEWKLYDYDRPDDLGTRLVAAGFVAEESEAAMFAEAGEVLAGLDPDGCPPEVTVEPVTDPDGLRRLIALQDDIFGHPADAGRTAELLAQLGTAPEEVGFVVARSGAELIAGARADFIPGTDFAGLFGGATAPAWRGRSVYRALVRYRAALAAERGYRYLFVDALPTSRPILERVGFARAAITTPYNWSPGEEAG